MAEFKLHAPYKPAGDQPKAINELVENLRRGVKYQVLLGVTGSGKSVTPDEPVFILEDGILRYVPIGEFVDRVFGIREQAAESVELPTEETDIFTYCFDPKSLEEFLKGKQKRAVTGFRKVRALIRHRAPSELYEVTTVSGHVIKVTGDHSMWAVEQSDGEIGALKLFKTGELKPGMSLPVIGTLPASPNIIKHINLLDYMDQGWDRLHVDIYPLVGSIERAKILRALKSVYNNPLNTYTHLNRRRVKVKALRTLLRILQVKKFEDLFEIENATEIPWHRVTVGSYRASIPLKLPITSTLMKFMGIYLAIGRIAGYGMNFHLDHAADSEKAFDELQSVAAEMGLHIQRTGDTARISSVAWAKLFGTLIGNRFGNKHLPDFWPSLQEEHLIELLKPVLRQAIAMPDGALQLTLKSPGLAADIHLSLRKIGIISELRWTRPKRGYILRDEASKSVLLIAHRPSVERLKTLMGSREELKERREPFVGDLFGNQLTMRPLELVPIKSIRKIKPQFRFVYDLSVDGCETFAAGLGGIFVHNTFTMANVIARIGKPTLVISHNKTLAAQLYGELKSFFPENAVEFFISYYDYYQPEAYIPETDTYIEKDADINEDIERLRLRATTALMERDDVIIVASVSAIYGLGDPEDVKKLFILVEVGQELSRDELIHRLVDIQYTRNDIELKRGTFRVRGDVVDVVPAYEEHIIRIEFFGDFVDSIRVIHPVTGKTIEVKHRVAIYPAGHWVTTRPKLDAAIRSIEEELEERLAELRAQGRLLEAQRLEQRTRFDLQMLREIGYCKGIENYSRHLSGRPPGTRPSCLIDYFPDDFLMIIDESHVTIPQLRGMYHGDRSRKLTLVEYGFRLPSALDNRPLKFDELEELWNQVIFVSATPGPYELEKSGGLVVEQIIRPTGLVDPKITVKPTENQIDVMIDEIRKRVDRGERVLITTITKRTAEELADYLSQVGFRVRYLHSEIDAIERVDILRGLRLGEFDVLVGVNLLREGLDLPEVSLVIITDADKTGFLRSETSLIQVAGRAARNAAGEVLMFADVITPAMKKAIEETERRRKIQIEYNKKHGIVPRTIRKSVKEIKLTTRVADERILEREDIRQTKIEIEQLKRSMDKFELVEELERRMQIAASLLEFEKAAVYRDALLELKGLKRSRNHKK